jgi:hypothetical protein
VSRAAWCRAGVPTRSNGARSLFFARSAGRRAVERIRRGK